MTPKTVDPYHAGIVKGDVFAKAKRGKVKGRIVVVHHLKLDNRGYQLIPAGSRVVLDNEIHELISTDERKARPGKEVNSAGVIGFTRFTTGGVIVVGDKVSIGHAGVGLIAGFDETHVPNHLNIIIKTSSKVSGFDLGIELEDEVVISPQDFEKGNRLIRKSRPE